MYTIYIRKLTNEWMNQSSIDSIESIQFNLKRTRSQSSKFLYSVQCSRILLFYIEFSKYILYLILIISVRYTSTYVRVQSIDRMEDVRTVEIYN